MGMESIYKLSVVLDMIDKLSQPMGKAAGKSQEAIKKMNAAFSSVQAVGGKMMGLGTAFTGASLGIVTSTFKTQDALGELASLGVENLQVVEKAAKDFSSTFAGTTKSEFISAAYDIKSGIASLTDEGVAQYTELAALTGKATKATTGEMTSLFATGYGIYKDFYSDLSDMEFGEVFSAGIATAVKSYKTNGSEMAAAISAIGKTATNANVPMEEQLAILGQLQATMGGSEAATKYKSFITQAASAGSKLNLTFTDSNNMLLSMPEILEQLKGKYGETLDAVEKQQLKEAFGTDEAIQLIDLLYGNVDTLKGGIESMADSMLLGRNATEEMANAIQNTPHQEFIRMKQEISGTVEEIASGLLPSVNEGMKTIGKWIKQGSAWISNNKETVDTITNIVLKLGIFLMIGGAAVTTVGTIGKMGLSLVNVFKLMRGAWTAISAAFSASPIGWIVLGVIALIAGFVLLWNKSESFRNFWIGMFNQVKNIFMNAWDSIRPALEGLGEKFGELYQKAKPSIDALGIVFGTVFVTLLGIVVGTLQGMAESAAPFIDAFGNLIDFVSNFVSMIDALFKGDLDGAFHFAMAALDNLNSFFINVFEGIGNFASGFVSGLVDTIGGAFSAMGIDVSGQLDTIKASVSEKITAVKNIMVAVTSAATNTVKQNLSNMKSAYDSHGGGIAGIAAASMESIKGFYSLGFTFIDSLTNGKLTSIKGSFMNKFSEIKNYLAGLPEQFRQSGAKIMETFTQGIRSAINKPVEAVKGALQEIRNMLPFSDAKKGPLSRLTLSGRKVFLTMAEGMEQTRNLPGDVVNSGLSKAADEMEEGSLSDRLSGRKIPNIKKEAKNNEESPLWSKTLKTKDENGQTIIQNVHITVDITKLKDLPMLFRLVDELKDSANGKGSPVRA